MRAWVTLTALALSTFVYVTVETLPIGLLPQIAQSLGTSTSAVGLLVTAYGFVVVVATVPLTKLAHRWSRRRLLGVLLGVFAVATAVSALAQSYGSLLAARVAIALSQAVFWAIVTPAAASLFVPHVRGRAISILYTGSSAAPLLGVPAGTWLGQQAGWRVPFLALSAIGLVVLVVIVALMPDLPPGRSDADRGTAPDPGRYWTLVVATALMVTGAFVSFTYINPFLTGVSGFAESAIGPILLVRGLAGLAGVIVAGFVVGRWGWPSLVVVTAGQAVCLLVLYAFGANGAAAVVASAGAGFMLAGMAAVLGARVLEVAPGATDLASAGTSTAFNVGITAGALIGSALLTGAGVRSTALVGGLVTMAALIAVLAEPRLATRRAQTVGSVT
ncbi:MFS transporter [Paractinoplanes deccanensis]|uniref:MFS transporter n=1 Tax=Paractinoplanes deccanensis TaxID=113561 RepID=A0ABQ3Y1L4_9ACTN|nr:MFS transporter [Actinoplanes deccanensis]GID73896.1 MFS transporter [Actinoplanes deccanensis]